MFLNLSKKDVSFLHVFSYDFFNCYNLDKCNIVVYIYVTSTHACVNVFLIRLYIKFFYWCCSLNATKPGVGITYIRMSLSTFHQIIFIFLDLIYPSYWCFYTLLIFVIDIFYLPPLCLIIKSDFLISIYSNHFYQIYHLQKFCKLLLILSLLIFFSRV